LPPPLPKRTRGCGAKLAEYDPLFLAVGVGVWLPSGVFSTTGGSCARFAASGAAPPPEGVVVPPPGVAAPPPEGVVVPPPGVAASR